MSEVNNTWGYQSDTDESLVSKQGGVFGLQKAFITKFEYNPLAGKDETPADAIDMTVTIGDKEFRSRIYDITGELFKGDNRIAPGEPGYAELYNVEKKQRTAVVIHAIKALGVTEEQIKDALTKGNVTDFKSWAEVITGLKPADFATKPVDVFLEYQWNIKDDNTRTFLQLPKNMKGGRFLSEHIVPVGKWNEVKEDGLKYVDDAKNVHPFTRSKNYMEGNKANQQIEGEDNTAGAAIEGTTATKSKW